MLNEANSGLNILITLLQNKALIPVVIGAGIAIIGMLIVIGIFKINKIIFKMINNLGETLKENINEKIDFFREDIRIIRECNQDLLNKYPVFNSIYEKRDIIEQFCNEHIVIEKSIEIEKKEIIQENTQIKEFD